MDGQARMITTMENELSVLVSGASVSGLSIAYWLSRYGFRVTVVEQAPHLRAGGQALDVRGAAALEVADRMDILTTIRERRTRLTGVSLVDPSGKEIFRSTERTLTGTRFDSSDVEILRDHLVEVLFEAVGDRVEYIFENSIASLKQDETGVDVAFINAPPRRFDLVIGADGVRSNVRRLVFGPDERFIRYLGSYIAVCAIPNFLGLDHWQTFCQHDGNGGGLLALAKDDPTRTYLGFKADEPIDYDYRDIDAQKRLLADRLAGLGWVFPQILKYMQDSSDFYFDSINQIRMDRWSDGRVVLLGDAGYAVSLATGQGTSVAMIAAYVLAGELAMHRDEPLAGLRSYERELRDYVLRNQELATQTDLPEPEGDDQMINPDSLPDFGEQAIPFDLKSYEHLSGSSPQAGVL
ncbi:FAD-dependent monooxygenase [Tardiphaga sp. 866_E4_N2_1]|uniref:FAD-dependent monooxygenase n=1 Tax=unclassified Tardiphaga TaxID=2631404 RepID=UPI003F29C0A6